MTDTDRMVAWLRAALDAAQRDAEAATAGPWYANEPPNGVGSGPSIGTGRVDWGPNLRDVVAPGDFDNRFSGVRHLEDARFIAANSPDVALRRIAADRKTLARHQPFENLEIVDMPKVGHVTRCAHDKQHWPCPDVTNLAEGWGWTEETP